MESSGSNPSQQPFTIRSFKSSDRKACLQLYTDGLTGGRLAENDTGLDMDDIESVYIKNPGNHFWVAEDTCGKIVGMIAVQHHEEGTGEIRRLRVDREHRRRGIGSSLLETALKFCEEHQYLKITLDTFMEAEPAIKLFEKFRFKHLRTRNVGGKDLMYFYLDLYDDGGQRKKSE